MNYIFVIITLLGNAIEVTKGVVTTEAGIDIKVGEGTFIPRAQALILAKKIVSRNSEIERLKINLSRAEDKLLTNEAFYVKKNSLLVEKIENYNSWWNRWGKPVLYAAVAATLTGFITYEVCK